MFPSLYKAFASTLWAVSCQGSLCFTALLLPMSATDITPYKPVLTVPYIQAFRRCVASTKIKTKLAT